MRTFTFRPPKSLLWTPTAEGDPGYPLIGDKFEFSNEPKWHDPYEFSQQVYLIMASMNQIGQPEQRQRVQIHAGHCRRQHGIHLHQCTRSSRTTAKW